MRTGGLNNILKTLLDNDNKGISNQELILLLQKIENDATEICYAKYGLDEKIKFSIDYQNFKYQSYRQAKRKITSMYQTIYQEKFGNNE